ncbi:ATP-binding protein [Streptomyces decoyicus]|uniref:sensor histidine kinase n=1 Tax=Streptomyces decoyicus TaxID=249567 RepID=UPI00345D64C1
MADDQESRDVTASDGSPNRETSYAAQMAESLEASRKAVLHAYREALQAEGSALCKSPHWEECESQANAIISDCISSVERDWKRPDERARITSMELGRRRAFDGVHPAYSFHACTVLFEVFLGHAHRAALYIPGDIADQLLVRVMRAFNSSADFRVQSAMQGYDAFLLMKVRNANSDDRLQLARDIHDHLGSSLAMTLRCLELHEAQELDGVPGKRLRDAYSSIQEVLLYTRKLVGDLRVSTPRAGLEASLKEFLVNAHYVSPKARITVSGDEKWMDRKFRGELFVVLRECLRNTFNYAKASLVNVAIDIAPHEINASVEDDGEGFDVAAVLGSGTASGLSSVRERVAELGGRARWTSAPGRGTRVVFHIPYTRPLGGAGHR